MRCAAWTSASPPPRTPTRKPRRFSKRSTSRSGTEETSMAKKSMVNRDLKRAKLIKQHAGKRADLKKIIANTDASYEDKMAAVAKLQKLPRDSSASRLRTRCAMTGRPRAVYAKFGLARSKLREATMRGDVPGLRKASWGSAGTT